MIHPQNKNKDGMLELQNDSTIIIELHPQEIELIHNLRTKFRFGEITIIMREGVPFRIRRITEFEDLDKK
jgi:hypothetical protein